MRTRSEREVRSYACPRLGKVVVFSYLFVLEDAGRGHPRGVHCAGACECGVERRAQGGGSVLDWRECPLYPDLVKEGYLSP